MKFTSNTSLANWLQTTDARDLITKTAPNQVNTAVLSQAHRFYWFNIHHEVDLNASWTLGANLHFDGNIGGVWVSLKYKVFEGSENEMLMTEAFEVHPYKPVRNPVRIPMQNRLRHLALILEKWNGKPRPAGCQYFQPGHITFA
jgi:hypothetical protein